MARNTPPGPQPAHLTFEQMKRGIPRLQMRIAELEAFNPQIQKRRSPEVQVLETSIEETLASVFGHKTVEYYMYKDAASLVAQRGFIWPSAMGGRNVHHDDAREAQQYLTDGKQRAILLLQGAVRMLEEKIANYREETDVAVEIAAEVEAPAPDLSKVFVVHGHDGAPKAEVARFIEKVGFEAIILHERPNKGRTIITKFREEAAGAGFAVVLMTPDDLGKAEKAVDLNPRARQNVIFELGFFIGKLGPERVVALVKGEIELPSDFEGVGYIHFDKEDWEKKLGRELREAGYEFDWNKVMGR